MTEHKPNTAPTTPKSRRGGVRPGAGPPTVLKDAHRATFIVDQPTEHLIEAYRKGGDACTRSQAVRNLIAKGAKALGLI